MDMIKRSVLFLSFLAYTCLVRSQSDSCSSNLAVGNLIPFNTSSLSCITAWKAGDFILRYGKTGANEWSFVLSAPDTGAYVSIGFSPTGSMVGSSAMAGWVQGDRLAMAKQYYLGGTSSKACPPDQGNLVLANSLTILQNSRLYLAFLLTGQPLKNVVYAVGPRNSLPSSTGYLPQHSGYSSGSIDPTGNGGGGGGGGGGGDGDGDDDDDGDGKKNGGKGGGGDDGNKGGSPPTTAEASTDGSGMSPIRKHGIIAIVGWGILIPIGVAMARFSKQYDPFWFYSHVSIQGIGFLLGVIAIVFGFNLEEDADIHKAIGIAILVCGSLQVIALLARPRKEAKARKYWKWYHHYVGRGAIVLAIANIFYGLSLAEEAKPWSYVYGISIGTFFVICFVLEEWRRKNI